MRLTLWDCIVLLSFAVICIAGFAVSPSVATNITLALLYGIPLGRAAHNCYLADARKHIARSRGREVHSTHPFVMGGWLLIGAAVFGAGIWWFGPQLVDGVASFGKHLHERTQAAENSVTAIQNWVRGRFEAISPDMAAWFDTQVLAVRANIAAKAGSIVGWLAAQVKSVVTSTAVSFLSTLIFTMLIVFYMVESEENEHEAHSYIERIAPVYAPGIAHIVHVYQHIVRAFFRGIGIIATLYAGAYWCVFVYMGMPPSEALVMAVICGTAAALPEIGLAFLLIVALPVTAVYFGFSLTAAWVVVVLCVIYVCMVMCVSPRLIGERVGVPPVYIMAVMMLMVGMLGAVVGVLSSIALLSAWRALISVATHADASVRGPDFYHSTPLVEYKDVRGRKIRSQR